MVITLVGVPIFQARLPHGLGVSYISADKDKRIKRRNERGRQIWIHDGRRNHECPERRSRWTEETCKADGAEAEGPRS